jgi:hypothetical protein
MQILGLFEQSKLSTDWEESFKTLLETKNLKQDYRSYHANPGGNRTYRSQLEALGLIYRENDKIEFTKAGEDLKNGVAPLKVLQTQLIRMQYPSTYSVSANVAIDESILVKPILFLMQLLIEFDYLNRDEVAVAVIYGHNHHDAFKRCCVKIKSLRDGTALLAGVVDDKMDLYTTKTLNRTVDERLNEIRNDIANTFENWAESAQLITWQDLNGERVNVLNPSALALVNSALATIDEFIEVNPQKIKENKIAFSRQFGNWKGQKDTRKLGSQVQSKKMSPEEILLCDELLARMSNEILSDNDIAIYKHDMLQLGLSDVLIDRIVIKYYPRNLSVFEDQYIRLSNSGKSTDGILFEKATISLLSRMNDSVMHTGQLRRPIGAGSYADIVMTHDDSAMIIDTKASPKYSLPHADKAKAVATYIPAWHELRDSHRVTTAVRLNNLCYIAGGFVKPDFMDSKLIELREDSGKVCAVNAIKSYSLLKYVQLHNDSSDFFARCSVTGLLDLA